jgi:hypothetical protein
MSSYQNMRLHNPIYFTFYLPVYYYKIYLFFLLTVKNLKMNEATSCNFTKNLFVSYCHRNKLIVHRIADELQNLNYKLWIDRDLHAGNKLYTEIEKGMQESNLVICFISKSYCESEDCVKELSFAHEKRKNILPIMLEREVSNGVGFLLSNILKFYAFKQPDTFEPWSKDHFNRLSQTVFDLLSKICIKCSKSVSATTNNDV